MNAKLLSAAAAILLTIGRSTDAHRLDEYLQATILSIEADRVEAKMRLTPGVAVWPRVRALIDEDADGAISVLEQNAYAARVLRDLTLAADGHVLPLQLLSATFPDARTFQAGLAEIQIEFSANLPSGGASRKLVFANHHESQIAAYLANCLVPRDGHIRIVAQQRNEQQSIYQVNYSQTTSPIAPASVE